MQKVFRFCNIEQYMNENYDLKRFGADKIAFLGMFLLSLLIAQLIVSINSSLVFTDPIELPRTGLSVSVPSGKGWKTTGKWQFEDNSFILSSNFIVERGLPAAVVNCRYVLTPQNMSPKMWLERQVKDPNSIVIETGKIQKGSLMVDWVHIETPFTIFLGNAALPNNRTFSIEVIQTTYELDIAEKVFRKVIDSLNLKEYKPADTGDDIVKGIRYESEFAKFPTPSSHYRIYSAVVPR